MCGSTDLIKKDGVFVCQYCGTKYTVEEARKIMIDGTVDVSGSTVKLDTSKELDNLYQIARRAKDDNNSENAAKYYDMILVKDPTSWEASFYLVYFKALECKIAQIQSAAITISNCIDTVLNLIKDYVSNRDEQILAVQEVTLRCVYISGVLYTGAKNHYDGIGSQIKPDYTQEMVSNCMSSLTIMYKLGDYIESIFDDYEELFVCIAESWKNGIDKHNQLMPYLANKNVNKEIMAEYTSKIQKYDKDYQMPTVQNNGGCYIATSVYGTYDCPSVWTLRRFRDYELASKFYGRLFIRLYYTISPTLVKWFGDKKWFKTFWKKKLDRMVEDLNAKGIENTPYEDKNWK